MLLYVIPWGCQLATNVPHGIFSGVFNVNTMQRYLLMFDQLDSKGIPSDQRYNINLIMDDISSGICHYLAL